jgi:oligopeptide transport system substrate-binding protein
VHGIEEIGMSFRSHKVAILTAVIALAGAPATARDLRANVVADPASLDPIAFTEQVAGRIMNNVYEGFVRLSDDGRALPALAESWEPLASGPGFRFHLRKGVLFHTGRPFTARDVKWTFERLLDPTVKRGLAAEYIANIVGAADVRAGRTKELTGVTMVDDHTVDIALTKPEVLFPTHAFYFVDRAIVAELGDDWFTKVSAGTGPFVYRSWRRGVEVRLGSNSRYWAGAPKIDGIRFLIVPNGDTVLSQYDAGELDFVDVYETSRRRVLRDDRYRNQLIKVARAQIRYLGMNQNLYGPFKDERVREAISLSIDRDALIQGLYDGAAFPLNGQVTPNVAGHNPNLPLLKYDPERAKRLIAEAGFEGGKGMPPIDITCTAVFKDEIAYYANQLKKVLGMQVNVNVMERASFIRAMNAGEVAFFPWIWTADYPDAAYFLAQVWYGTSPFNRSRWKNADYDRVIDEALVTSDPAKRFELYHRAEKILLDDWGTAPLPTLAAIGLRKPNVRGVTLTPFGFSSFANAVID